MKLVIMSLIINRFMADYPP